MTIRRKLVFVFTVSLACIVGLFIWYSRRLIEPVYEGKRLSVWAAETAALERFDIIVNGDSPSVRAMQAIGTNAIPWLLGEMRKPPSIRSQLNRILARQSIIKYRFSVSADAHQIRARCGFWALGKVAEPAIPDLVRLLEQQPEFAPSALAGIGPSALGELHYCLTNVPTQFQATNTWVRIADNTLASLYVALSARHITKSNAEFLLPTVQGWRRKTNTVAGFWAGAVLREFESNK